MRSLGLYLLAILVSLAGCSGNRISEEAPGDVASDSAVADRVMALDFGSVDRAFGRLQDVPHSITRTTLIAAETGEPAYERTERLLASDTSEKTYQSADVRESGRAPTGFFSRLHRPGDDVPIDMLPNLLLEDEPAFAMPQNETAFLYRSLPDTTLRGQLANVIHIRRRTGENRGRPYESVRLYVEPTSSEVIRMDALLIEDTIFLSRRSTHRVELMPAGGGDFLPATAAIESEIDLLLSPPQKVVSSWRFDATGEQ